MGPLRLAALALAFLVAAGAATAATYGAGVPLVETTKISAILSSPAVHVGRTVAVEGTVVEVCAKRGCWLELGSDQKYQSMRVKVEDGVIVFPLSARGKTARVQGQVEEIRMSREEALEWGKHLAEEQGKPFDPATVTGPVTTYRIRATGAVIP